MLQALKNSGALKALEAQQANLSEHTFPAGPLNIPPRPQIFFGRAEELSAIGPQLITGPPGRVAVLGGPGVTETTSSKYAFYL